LNSKFRPEKFECLGSAAIFLGWLGKIFRGKGFGFLGGGYVGGY
jgi:hypothetical protein